MIAEGLPTHEALLAVAKDHLRYSALNDHGIEFPNFPETPDREFL